MADTVSDVLTRYRVDTSDMEAGLGRISSQQKDMREAELAASGERNQGLEGWVQGLGEVGLALEGVHKLVEIGKEAFADYANEVRLSLAAAGADMEKLSEAAGHLRTEDELRAFAAKAMHGIQALNNEQMADTLAAMKVLTREGFDQADVTEKLTNAVVSLKTKGLDKLGVAVESTGDKAKDFKAIMGQIHEIAQKGAGSTETEAESIQRLGVTWRDAMDKIKESIGRMVVALGPLIEKVASLASKAAGLVEKISSGWSDLASLTREGFGNKAAGEALNAKYGVKRDSVSGQLYNADVYDTAVASGYDGTSEEFYEERAKNIAALKDKADQESSDLRTGLGEGKDFIESLIKGYGSIAEAALDSFTKKAVEARKKAAEAALEKAKREKTWAEEEAAKGAEELIKKLEDEQSYAVGFKALERYKIEIKQTGDEIDDMLEKGQLWARQLANQISAPLRYSQYQEKSFLEQTFGKKEEFDVYKTLFSSLTGAITKAYDAWIDGNMSAGDAVKAFVRDALKSLGERMLVRSVEELAEGFASLALGPLGGASASQHFVAAGLFASGAALAGIAAKAIGPSGSTSSSSAGAGAGGSVSGGSSSSSGSASFRPIIIAYGDAFAEDSPRMRQRKAQRLVQLGLGQSSGGVAA